jgi:hypothetical protein
MADDSPTVRTPTPGGAPDTRSTGAPTDTGPKEAIEPDATAGQASEPTSTATSDTPTPAGNGPPSMPPGTPPGTPSGGSPRRRVSPLLIIVIAVVGAILFATWRPMLPGVTPTPLPTASTAIGETPSAEVSPSIEGTPSVPTSPTPLPPSPRPPGDYILMSKAALMALPTKGAAWENLVAIANGPIGPPDLTDQDNRVGVMTLASALVFARTGDATYRERARSQIMAAIGTEQEGAPNSILSLGRQLGAYVLAADFIELSDADDATFRPWLDDIRTRELGGHGRWISLTATHEDAPQNWGSFAGASRIAASLYLNDTADVARAAQVLRGFLGDRSAYTGFQGPEGARSWSCDPAKFIPINGPCTLDGIDLDGAIVRDIDRGGNRKWPPGRAGIGYTLESLQALTLQAELLTVNGYGDAWTWSDQALKRAAGIVTRSGQAGGLSWNRSEVSYYVPWILNARYGLDLPTLPAGFGRVFGYTDWLYGS